MQPEEASSRPAPRAAPDPTAGGDQERLAYEELTDPAFAVRAAEVFSVRPVVGGVRLDGPCPRCGDPMDFPHVDQTYKKIRVGRRSGEARKSSDLGLVRMVCTCTGEHPGRPEGEDGCGAYWNLTLGPPAS
jgi:hypothetical protein